MMMCRVFGSFTTRLAPVQDYLAKHENSLVPPSPIEKSKEDLSEKINALKAQIVNMERAMQKLRSSKDPKVSEKMDIMRQCLQNLF